MSVANPNNFASIPSYHLTWTIENMNALTQFTLSVARLVLDMLQNIFCLWASSWTSTDAAHIHEIFSIHLKNRHAQYALITACRPKVSSRLARIRKWICIHCAPHFKMTRPSSICDSMRSLFSKKCHTSHIHTFGYMREFSLNCDAKDSILLLEWFCCNRQAEMTRILPNYKH